MYTEVCTCQKTYNVICSPKSFNNHNKNIKRVKLSLLNTIELCSLFMASGAAVISLTVWPRVTKL